LIAPPNASVFFVVACFLVTYLVVSRLLVKPLSAMLDERERRAGEARGGFESASAGLKDALARCERDLAGASAQAGRDRLALRAEGESSRATRLAAAREQVAETLAGVGRELDDASTAARAALRDSTAVLARELADRLLGRRVGQ
jgi:F-type H+-transporting ATPase subunit b